MWYIILFVIKKILKCPIGPLHNFKKILFFPLKYVVPCYFGHSSHIFRPKGSLDLALMMMSGLFLKQWFFLCSTQQTRLNLNLSYPKVHTLLLSMMKFTEKITNIQNAHNLSTITNLNLVHFNLDKLFHSIVKFTNSKIRC